MSDPACELAAATRDLDAAALALADRGARAGVLEAMAAALDEDRAEIIATTAKETALYPAELEPEFDRMTGTLRMFGALVREGSWVRAAIDTPIAAGGKSIGPNHDIRRMLIPLGPVAVFGASNFPLAYGVCGGDTASALGAGCPVIVKEHPAHPRTGRLLKLIVHRAMARVLAGSVEGLDVSAHLPLRYVEDSGESHAVGTALAESPEVAAIGFTGSRAGGAALERIAQERARGGRGPIPVFAEMGSANRVVVCRNALRRRGPEIAAELANSILARHGQQCTKPGIIAMDHDPEAGPAFVAELARLLDSAPPRRLLSQRITSEYLLGCGRLMGITGLSRATSRPGPLIHAGDVTLALPMLFAAMDPVRGNLDYLQMFAEGGAALTEEIFGPAALVFAVDGWQNLLYTDPSLVTSVYGDEDDLATVQSDGGLLGGEVELALGLRHAVRSTGRLVFNSVPTGVRVCTSMVHGGPFPATNRPDTTAVGPLAIERWCRPVCFQNCPDALLPPELQDANPLGVWRIVNGLPGRDPIRRER